MLKLTLISILLLLNINFASYAMQTTQNNEEKKYAQETCSLLIDLWYNHVSLLQQNIDFNREEENEICNRSFSRPYKRCFTKYWKIRKYL